MAQLKQIRKPNSDIVIGGGPSPAQLPTQEVEAITLLMRELVDMDKTAKEFKAVMFKYETIFIWGTTRYCIRVLVKPAGFDKNCTDITVDSTVPPSSGGCIEQQLQKALKLVKVEGDKDLDSPIDLKFPDIHLFP